MTGQWFFLENPVQHYHWGSTDAIRNLMNMHTDDTRPLAELWMGAHESAPSGIVINDTLEPLTHCIARNPESILGTHCRKRFGDTLPYLFKVLSAAHPLSIQVHPDIQRARKGFERENRDQIPLDAPNRNYKDPNHKPELLAALTRFTALCGFRPVEETAMLFRKTGIRELLPAVAALESTGDYRLLLEHIWSSDRTTETAILEQLSLLVSDTPEIPVSEAEKHPFAAVQHLVSEYGGDIGVLAPLYLNTVTLEPGEALFLPAGILHSYIQGTGLELMANSDNVLRGGLTSKYIDIPEVLSAIIPHAHTPARLIPVRTASRSVYPTPAKEFELSILEPDCGNIELDITTPSIMVILYDDITISGTSGTQTAIPRGASLFLPAYAGSVTISGTGTVYLASVPENAA